jgi:hypothetical protein
MRPGNAHRGSTRHLVDLRMLLASAACLLLGSLVYLLVRAEPVWFVPLAWHRPLALPHWLCVMAGSLPAAVHVVALSLATAALLRPRSAGVALAIGCAWALINIVFELGQHPDLSPRLVAALPARLEGIWLLDTLRRYFTEGSFDFLDIFAAVAGAVGARHLIARFSEETRHGH